MTSAYPLDVDTLAERVRARAAELGELPAQRRVMAEFKVGRPKATEALRVVAATGFTTTPAAAPDAPAEGPAERRLHAVDTPTHTPADDPADRADLDTEDAPETQPPTERDPAAGPPDDPPTEEPSAQFTPVVDAPTATESTTDETRPEPERPHPETVTATVDTDRIAAGRVRSWPLLLLALGAFVSIWGGWVGLGELTGFGLIRLLPGIADDWVINSAITLPIGVEAYAAYALRAWLAPHPGISDRARGFAMVSAIGSLVLGAAGQVAYHLMTAAEIRTAPWPITAFVACLPVVVLGCGAALTHLLHHPTRPISDAKDAR